MVIENMMWFCCGHHVQDSETWSSTCLALNHHLVWGWTGLGLNRCGSQTAWLSTSLVLNRHGLVPATYLPGLQPAWS